MSSWPGNLRAILLILVTLPGCTPGVEYESVRNKKLQLKGVTLEVEVAADESTRAVGFMFREDIADREGILFVLPESEPLGFWMKNCLVPIDIAYIDPDFRVTDIYTMEPEPESRARSTYRTYDASKPVPYALELRGGWFGEHGVKVGDTIDLTEVLRGVQPR